jgi:hypothetical protein
MLGIINGRSAIDLLSCNSALVVSVVFVLPRSSRDGGRLLGEKETRQEGGRGVAIWLTRHIDVLRQPASVRADAL